LRIQPAREFLQGQSKQIQAKLLGFAWFYSFESGLFNGLGPKKAFKSASSQVVFHSSQAPAPATARRSTSDRESITRISDFRKQLTPRA
jgi:hypothetical protein